MRRAAIIDAAIPLLRRHGPAITTKQIADAAGIAEGTLFRVFDDKDALIRATVDQVMDQRPAIAALRRIDVALPLRERLRAAVVIITARLDAVWELMFAMRMLNQPDAAGRRGRVTEPADQEAHDALTALVGADADQLRVPPEQAARLLRLITFAGSHPRITNAHPLTADEIVDLLLDGVRAHSACTPSPSTPPTDANRDAPC